MGYWIEYYDVLVRILTILKILMDTGNYSYFYNNYSNNLNFNNKSDKIKILRIRMITHHRQ
jgi:hypothetical protein